MSFKTTYILFGVLIGMLGLLGLTLALKRINNDPGALFPSFTEKGRQVDMTEINTVEVEQKGKDKLVFLKSKQGWRLAHPLLKVDTFPISALIREIMEAHREEDTDVTNSPERWGLTHPSTVVTLKKGTREWTLKLGDQSPEENGVVYAMSSDRPNEVMAVRRASLASAVNFKLDQVWSRKLLEADPFVTRALTVRGPVKHGASTTEKSFTLRKKGRVSFWFVAPPFGPAEMEAGMFDLGEKRESPGVRGLLLAINDLQAEGLEPFDAHNLKWYGLEDGAKVLRITVKNVRGGVEDDDAGPETLLVNEKVDKIKGKESKQYYARLASGQAVFRVSDKKLEKILSLVPEEGERLRSLQVIQLRPTDPDAIDIHTAKGDVQLRRLSINDWKVNTASIGVQKADHVFIQQLLGELGTNHMVKGFQASGKSEEIDKKLGLTSPAATISIWVGGIVQEKKDLKSKDKKRTSADLPAVKGKPAVVLAIGSSGGKAYVKREAEGEINRVEVPVALLERVDKAPKDYLDRNITSFAMDQVIGLVRTIDGKAQVISREDIGKPWKLMRPKRPSTRVDDAGLMAVLGQVAKLDAVQWIKIKPSETDVKDLKLDKPRLKVEVKVKPEDKKDPKALAFAFGADKAYDKNKTGAACLIKLPDSDHEAIVLVDPSVVRLLQTTELRNRTVFNFEAAKVEKIHLQGWDNLKKRGKELELTVEREPEKSWRVVKSSQAGFKLDDRKVDLLLEQWKDLKLERLVDDPPGKEYDLKDPANRALTAAITLKGATKPLTLTIGKQKGKDPSFYAEASTLPGEVFLIPGKGLAELLAAVPWVKYFDRASTKRR